MKRVSLLNILKGLFVSLSLILALYLLIQIPFFNSIKLKILGKKTTAQQVALYENRVMTSLKPMFDREGAEFPPRNVSLLFLKSKRVLELYAPNARNEMRLIKVYSVHAASGKPGPKLQDGDYQVPEGVYSIESLNPNSAYHLSLRLNYPNRSDQARAKEDGRINLGSDIMIHGNKVSIGCIAVGDEAIEELFVLAAKSEYRNWTVISSPVDFRTGEVSPALRVAKNWIPALYQEIAIEMQKLK